MKNSSFIQLKDHLSEIRFEWCDFDGDDCFNDFHIDVITASKTRRFEFGGCVIRGLRKLTRFFQNTDLTSESGGFRHPDVRHFEVHRLNDGYGVVIMYEGSGLHEQFQLRMPIVQIDQEFLREYYE